MAKAKKITLIHPSGSEHEFEAAHAHRIMGMENNGGWEWKDKTAKKEDANIKGRAKGKAAKTATQDDDCGCSGT